MLHPGDREETQRQAPSGNLTVPACQLKGQREEVPLLKRKSQGHPAEAGATGACPAGGRATEGMWLLTAMLPKAESTGKDQHSGFPHPLALPSPMGVKMSEGKGQSPRMQNRAGQGQ